MSKAVFLEQLCEHIQEKRVQHLRSLVSKDFIGGQYYWLYSHICIHIHSIWLHNVMFQFSLNFNNHYIFMCIMKRLWLERVLPWRPVFLEQKIVTHFAIAAPTHLTSQMIYHRGGESERVMYCWINVMAHKPWITAEFVTVYCSMSVASNTYSVSEGTKGTHTFSLNFTLKLWV